MPVHRRFHLCCALWQEHDAATSTLQVGSCQRSDHCSRASENSVVDSPLDEILHSSRRQLVPPMSPTRTTVCNAGRAVWPPRMERCTANVQRPEERIGRRSTPHPYRDPRHRTTSSHLLCAGCCATGSTHMQLWCGSQCWVDGRLGRQRAHVHRKQAERHALAAGASHVHAQSRPCNSAAPGATAGGRPTPRQHAEGVRERGSATKFLIGIKRPSRRHSVRCDCDRFSDQMCGNFPK